MSTPDTRLAAVVCAARPSTMPTIPAEANMPTASFCSAAMSRIKKATPRPRKRSDAEMSRSIMRSFVAAAGSIWLRRCRAR